jgi:hypothetical protein
VFLYLDWWPVDGNGRHRYEPHRAKLEDNIGHLDNPVDVVYLSRRGDNEVVTLGD